MSPVEELLDGSGLTGAGPRCIYEVVLTTTGRVLPFLLEVATAFVGAEGRGGGGGGIAPGGGLEEGIFCLEWRKSRKDLEEWLWWGGQERCKILTTTRVKVVPERRGK